MVCTTYESFQQKNNVNHQDQHRRLSHKSCKKFRTVAGFAVGVSDPQVTKNTQELIG
jgi:hypothetical protein